MTGPRFASALAPMLEDYVAFKAAMGRTGDSRIWNLRHFDAYYARNDKAAFDRDPSRAGCASASRGVAGTGRGCPTSATWAAG